MVLSNIQERIVPTLEAVPKHGQSWSKPGTPEMGTMGGMGLPVPELTAGLGYTYSLCSVPVACAGQSHTPHSLPIGKAQGASSTEGRARWEGICKKIVLLRKPPETLAMRAPQTLPRLPYSSLGGPPLE